MPSDGASVATADAEPRVTRGWRLRLRNLLHEPLLHFLVIGAVLFGLNAVAAPPGGKDRIIDVTPEVRQSIVDLFRSKRMRDPTPDELASLIDVWVLNEITYREALAQGLDKGDEMIRERIMQKMRVLVFGNVNVSDPTDADLQQWLEERRSRYDIPERLSFFELKVGGADAAAEAADILRQIETESEPEAIRLRARPFMQRPRQTVVDAFGKDFVDQLVALPIGQWRTLQSQAGWHIVRLDAIEQPQAAVFEDIRDKLFLDAKQDRVRTAAIATIRDMGKSYVIRRSDRP
jgi:hypothetical protein